MSDPYANPVEGAVESEEIQKVLVEIRPWGDQPSVVAGGPCGRGCCR